MSRGFLVLVGMLACGPAKPNVTLPPPTVAPDPKPATDPDAALAPPQPTLRLPKNFVPIGYAPRLVIDPSKPTFEGSIAITGNVSERSSVIWLHAWKLEVTTAVAKADTRAV